MQVLDIAFVLGVIAYLACVAAVVCALRSVRTGNETALSPVSVIVAARNEAEHLGRCLESLRAQDYPPDRYEVIVADDRSTDGTADILRRYEHSWNGLRALHIDRTPEGVSPKKHALASAAAHARGEIILQTDADCEAPEHWITGMVSRFEPEVGFVAGIAPYRAGNGWLNSFIRHEYLWNAALSAASIALGRGTHASGRNLGFRKQVFDDVGGYGGAARIRSGDDTLLLHRILRSGIACAATMPARETHVYTEVPRNFPSFLCQRIRHMSTGRYFDPVHLLIGMVVYGFHIVLAAALALSALSGGALALFLIGFMAKTAADGIAAMRVKCTLGLEIEWRRFVFNEFLMIFYMAFLPLAGLFVPVKWKEKNIENQHAI
jgi:cellulose synthase/poly-beta-1,6-N-acetylglucosamine synthase-like glycosyltransferase